MNTTQEKDYFWFYVGGVVATLVIVLLMVKNNEHGKYESTAKAIAEDSSNSAYRNSKL